MRIYAMTATFGKLEHETLILKPGLNCIHAPNEWGKSTWCAFIAAMLYGLDTRVKSTKTVLTDKERYTPWSGSPMSGRMDISWNGRNITIERSTRGRIPMGEFRAYETQSGLPVSELNAANCGTMLLGVERSVFLRSAFIRFRDLPVSQDEALRRRLNSLVSTGDEQSSADRLEKTLRDLKNKCRYHKNGLIPQAEAERYALEETIGQIEELEHHSDKIRLQLEEINRHLAQLENHKAALAFDAAEADARHVAQARQLRDEAADRLRELDATCSTLPEREEIYWALNTLDKLEQNLHTLEMETQLASEPVFWPRKPEFAAQRTPDEIVEAAKADAERCKAYTKSRHFWPILGILLAFAGFFMAFRFRIPGFAVLASGAGILLLSLIIQQRRKHAAEQLFTFYRSDDPQQWIHQAENYRAALVSAQEKEASQQKIRSDLSARSTELNQKIHRITQGKGIHACRASWEDGLRAWDALADTRRDLQRAENQLQALQSMARTAKPPKDPDTLTYSATETDRLLTDGYVRQRQLESRLSQYTGQKEALGSKAQLEAELDRVNQRLAQLEDTYAALTIALDTLAQATAQFQQRFAPRIAKRACALMSRMTSGRYERVQLTEDFSVLAGAEQEDTLKSLLWRSEGTVDQLYLALRLAVAEALTPDAPLILDDALVRFDDDRLKAALEILKEESKTRQVILFSCQNREKKMLAGI